MNNNSIFSRLVIRFFGCLIFLIISHPLFAQDFFPCGVFNFDVRRPEYAFSSQEFQRIRDINANWVSSVSLTAQGGMIDSFSTLSGEIKKMTLERDTLAIVFGHYYPVNPGGPEPIRDLTNTLLWRYICDNDDVADIDSAHVDSFVTHIDSLYNGCSGLGAVRVAHQGYTGYRDHWPFIRRAGRLVETLLGANVQSVATHNIFHWDYGNGHVDTVAAFFSFMGDSLDVYQHEEYPFYRQNTTPFTHVAFMGDTFQLRMIDTLLLGGYDST